MTRGVCGVELQETQRLLCCSGLGLGGAEGAFCLARAGRLNVALRHGDGLELASLILVVRSKEG